jgi:hypothetical protein
MLVQTQVDIGNSLTGLGELFTAVASPVGPLATSHVHK